MTVVSQEYNPALENIKHLLPIGRHEDGTLIFPKGVEPYYIRTSERGQFKKCRVLWDFTSQNRRNLEPVKLNNNLLFGIAVHSGLEEFYRPERWDYPLEAKVSFAQIGFGESLENQRQGEIKAQGEGGSLDHERQLEYDEMRVMGMGMLEGYAHWSVKEDDFKPIAVEKRYQVLIPDERGIPLVVNNRPVVYQLRIDLIVEDKHGRIWLVDHKTAARLDNLAFLDVDTQLSAYCWAMSIITGKHVQGLLYNELVKSVPHPPNTLKKGNLSQDKRQNTTYELYVSKIEELGLDKEPYEGILDYLQANPPILFRRTPVVRTPAELEHQGLTVLDEVRDMLIGTSGNGATIYPSPSKMNCNNCDFRPPCTVRSEQGDVEFILNDPKLFRQRVITDPTEEEAY